MRVWTYDLITSVLQAMNVLDRFRAATSLGCKEIAQACIRESAWLGPDSASKNGNISLLDWWMKDGIIGRYSHRAMDWASAHGHLDVLKWWKSSGLELKYTENAMDWASGYGRIDVLSWWRANLPIRYTHRGIDLACAKGHVNVLEWWDKEVGIDGNICNSDGWALAKYHGHSEVLSWCAQRECL